jgi:peptidoglycan/LPS O-acetylase OafA/YrhL
MIYSTEIEIPAPEHAPITTAPETRRHDLDALRGFAMLLGVVLHISLAFFPSFWPVQDQTSSIDGQYDEVFHAIHGFRMPLFFLLSGLFTAMLWRRHGIRSLVWHRVRRIALPMAIGVVTVVPLINWVSAEVTKSQIDDIWGAIMIQNAGAVEGYLNNGNHPNSRGDNGLTLLHMAALIDNAEIAEILLKAGSDPNAVDKKGDSALGYAFFVGSNEVADVLVKYGIADIRPQETEWEDLKNPKGEKWGHGDTDKAERSELNTWITSFHHLWFLWFLLWLLVGFVVIAALANRVTDSLRSILPEARQSIWLLIPVTLLFQVRMGAGGDKPVFGPDTSTGLIPEWHVLAYYAVFFAFGSIAFGRRTVRGTMLIDAPGRWWFVILPLTLIILFPIGLVITFLSPETPWVITSVLQIAFTWAMIFGLLGLFRALLSQEYRLVRYLSDASYWLYLIHLPLVILAQSWVRTWDAPSGAKFFGLLFGVSIVLLISYHVFVRRTPIGWLLNGRRRSRPMPEKTQEHPS